LFIQAWTLERAAGNWLRLFGEEHTPAIALSLRAPSQEGNWDNEYLNSL